MPATSPSTPHHPKLPYSRYSPNTASIGPAEASNLHRGGIANSTYTNPCEGTRACSPNVSELTPQSELGKRSAPSYDKCYLKKLKSDIDTAAPPPSFDLRIDSSPTHSSEATRSDKIFANDPYTPSSKVSDRSTSALQPSCAVVELSPTRDSKHLAQCVILDLSISLKKELIRTARFCTVN